MPKYKSVLDAPHEVIVRYFRIKYVRRSLAVARLYSRISLTMNERKKNKVLKSTLDIYKREATRAQRHGNECVQILMNMGLFYLLAENDIQAVKIDALTHPNEWKRNLSLRIILLTIYEWDMGKVSGKGFNELLNRAAVPAEIQAELFHSLRTLKRAQKKAASLLHEKRNSIIAHRDPDALMQIKAIESLSAKEVFGAAEDFYAATDVFMKAFAKVLTRAGSFEGLVTYMLNRGKPNKAMHATSA